MRKDRILVDERIGLEWSGFQYGGEQIRCAKKMADSRRIDVLRALALSSMPSLARRPVPRQNSGFIDFVEQRKSFVSACPAKSDDKEEGELSSDDEVERSATPSTSVETSLSFAHRNAGLSLHAPSQGNLKDERHTSAATSAESVPHIGVSSASVFSTSTRVSIVNKSQLLSAFTAQAPPLISSQTPEPVHNGSGVGIAATQSTQNLLQGTPSGVEVYDSTPSSCHGALVHHVEAASTATLQLTSTTNSSLSQKTQNVLNHEAISGLPGASTQSPIFSPTEVPSSLSPSGQCPVPPIAVPTVTRDFTPVLASVTALGAPESTGVAADQAVVVPSVVTGLHIPRTVATASAVSTFVTPVIGSVVVRKEAGVRKEAEAFLASLRIPLPSSVTPLPNSGASGDEKEDAFLITFDEDSDSDGENEDHSNPISGYPGRGKQKGTTSSSGPMSTSVLSQSNPVMPNQSPSDLKAEIDRMKKQIAAMERTKGKTAVPLLVGKSSRILSADATRHMVPPATEPKAGSNLAATSIRPASVDLESMRLRIAAKESELQQRRQRLAVKGPESGKGLNDLKGTAGAPITSLPPTCRSSQIADGAIAHAGNLISKTSSEKGMSGLKKEVHTRAHGIPALALAGPAGANLASLKINPEWRGLDGGNDLQHLRDQMSNSTALQVRLHVSEAVRQHSVIKGSKRLRTDGENGEAHKVPRFENTPLLEKNVVGDVSEEVTLPYNINEISKDRCANFASVQILSQPKRKVDATQTVSGIALSGIVVDSTSPADSEATKKRKTNSGVVLIDSGHDVREKLLVNSEQHAHTNGHHAVRVTSSMSKVLQLSTNLDGEKRNFSLPNSDTSSPFAHSSLGSLKAMSDVAGGTAGSCDAKWAASLSTPHPVVTENCRGSVAVQKSPEGVLTTSNGIQNSGVNGGTDKLQLQRGVPLLERCNVSTLTFGDPSFTADLPQAVVKVRNYGQNAHCSAMSFSEHQPKPFGMSNLNSSLSTENNGVHTTISWRPVNPVPLHAPKNLENQVEHYLQPGHSRIHNEPLDAEHDNFQHLLEEEELLDRQLQDVQLIRQRCENRERVARREYREAQCALRAANADCQALNQRKEFLLSRMHAAEARHYSGKAYLDGPLLPFGGTLVMHDQRKDEHPPSVVSVPNRLPGNHAADGPWEVDVNGEQDRSDQVHENLSPLSLNGADVAALACRDRDVQSGVSMDRGADYPSHRWVKGVALDGKGKDSSIPTVAGVECSGQMEDHSVIGEERIQGSVENGERQEDLDSEIVEGCASQSGTQYLTQCTNDLKNNGEQICAKAGLEDASLTLSDISLKSQNVVVGSMFTPDTRAAELLDSALREDIEPVPQTSLCWTITECTKNCAKPCPINHICVGGPGLGAVSAVCSESVRLPVFSQNGGTIVLHAKQVNGQDLEHEGKDQEYHDVEQITNIHTPHDAQSVDSLQSIPDNPALVLDLDGTDAHESGNTGEGNLLQDDLIENAPSMIHRDHAVPTCFKESTITDIDCCLKSMTRDLSVSVVKECPCQVVPEKSSLLQDVESLDNESAAEEFSKNDKRHSEEIPFEPKGEVSLDVSYNIPMASEPGVGIENMDLEPLADESDDCLVSFPEPQQCSNRHPPFARNLLHENPDEADCANIKRTQWPLPDMEQVNPVLLADSSIISIPTQPEGWEVHSVNELTKQGGSPHSCHSVGATDDIIAPDVEVQRGEDVGIPKQCLGVHVVEDVEFLPGASHGKNSSAPEPVSNLLNVQEDLECGVLRESCQGESDDDFEDLAAGTCLRKQSPTHTTQVCTNDTLISVNQYIQPFSKDEDSAGNSSSVKVQLADATNLNASFVLQGFVDCLGDQQLDKSEVLQQSAVKMSFDDNNTIELVSSGVDLENGDRVQDGYKDLCRIDEPEMMTDSTETTSQSELGSQELGQAMTVGVEDQQQDHVNDDHSQSGDLNHEVASMIGRKGVEVEVFRKALLDENVFERRASSGNLADATNSQMLNRDEVSEQILPQLQHHRLEHLLDMVEVRGPKMSLGGDSVVQEDINRFKFMASPLVVHAVQLDSPTLKSCNNVPQFTEEAQVFSEGEATATHPSSIPEENSGVTSRHWVPSAVSLAVLSYIPREGAAPLSKSGDDAEMMHVERGSEIMFGGSVVPVRYESPLTIFRSYRICPQFSGALHLSFGSSSWSHAINPFVPLCKFEHRGKCNNDDCPWQHADDYLLSSSQLECQIVNYGDQSGFNSDYHGVAVKRFDKDVDVSIAAIPLPALDSSVTAIITKAQVASQALPKSSMETSSVPLKWNEGEAVVPIYRTGSYTLKAEYPTQTCCLSYNLQLDRKVDSFHSFLLSPSIHRPLPLDTPCLLDASEYLSLVNETPTYHPGSPHWRYMGDIQEKLMCTKDGGALQDLIDEEMWLELALHHIDYDIGTENYKARDQALFYLSRALESNPSSVSLWVVYSCLFHMRKENPEKDDMFHHAVQYNQGSYELWVLYINSRSDFKSRLEGYEKAIVALVDDETQLWLDKEELSACILDIGLQMLYCWCVAGCPQDFLWVEDLICEASTLDGLKPRRESTAALLSHLTQHDACILWIACTYFQACSQLPTSIITRLGCKQELPEDLNWEKHAKVDEISHRLVIKALSTAASQGLGCLSLDSQPSSVDEDNFPRQVLGVNYIQCLALYEGLDSAACLGQKLMRLHPTSLELIVICARIDERRKGPSAGLHIFDEAVLQWPRNFSGFQHLWNQYAGHALLWGGRDLAQSALLKCIASSDLCSIEVEVSPWRGVPVPVSAANLDQAEGTSCMGTSGESWSSLREYFEALTSTCKGITRPISNHQLSQLDDSVFALINLALVEALSGDIASSQSAINKAMKAAISHKDLRHCWRELAAFQQVFCAQFASKDDCIMSDQSMLSLLDRCKTDSHILSQLTPLSQKAFQNFRKPHVRKFFEDLVGPPPLDYSVLNSILHMFYGPQLLPATSHALKKVFHFAECILEAMPGNVPLASSLCKIVDQNSTASKRMYKSAAIWASALLCSALHLSCPVAPEIFWVEAGLQLRQLGYGKSLKEFYDHALVKYPFSVALQRGLKEVQDRLQILDGLTQCTN